MALTWAGTSSWQKCPEPTTWPKWNSWNQRAQPGDVGARRVLVGGDIEHRHRKPPLGIVRVVGVAAFERGDHDVLRGRGHHRENMRPPRRVVGRQEQHGVGIIAERLAEVGPAQPVDKAR